jgi:hypothetical protein
MFYLCRHLQGEFRPSAEVSDARFVEFEILEDLMEPEHYEMVGYALSKLPNIMNVSSSPLTSYIWTQS